MKCLSCDEILTPRESVRRVKSSGEFLDLCDKCYATISEDVVTYTKNAIFGEFQEGGVPPPLPDEEEVFAYVDERYPDTSGEDDSLLDR